MALSTAEIVSRVSHRLETPSSSAPGKGDAMARTLSMWEQTWEPEVLDSL